MRLYGITGWKNNGKTTLVERLVQEFIGRGLTVSTIKHTHHAFDFDTPGRDSFRHRDAGAQEVLVASGGRWALMRELRGAEPPSLEALAAKLSPVDLVLVEGFKGEKLPKIEVHRSAAAREALVASTNGTVRAIASDTPELDAPVPVLPLDDLPAIADFILADLGMPTWR